MLFLAEKPEVGRAIASSLGSVVSSGNGYIEIELNEGGVGYVSWAWGHLLRLKYPDEYDDKYKKWSLGSLPIDYPLLSEAEFVPVDKDREAQLSVIESLLNKVDSIVHAGDMDDEGQLIIDSILYYFDNKKPVKRLLVNSLTEADIKKEYEDLKDNKDFEKLTESAIARTASDMLYGFNLTRLYTLLGREKGLEEVLSAGRVQTPTLGLVINRYNENKSHKKVDFFTVYGDFQQGDIRFNAKMYVGDNATFNLHENGSFLDESEAKKLIEDLADLPVVIKSLKTTTGTRQPPLPFNITNLQKEAHKRYKYSPKKVVEITQTLRETHKAITYNRTDSSYLKESSFIEAPAILEAINQNVDGYGSYPFNSEIKSKAFDDEKCTAHHAIIPTTAKFDVKDLSNDELRIYKLIADRFCVQFLEPEEFLTTKIEIVIGDNLFKASEKQVTKKGFTVFGLGEDDEEEKDTNSNGLNLVSEDQELKLMQCDIKKGKTNPPPLYDQSSLATDLTMIAKYVKDPEIKKILIDKDKGKVGESGSIGTGATRHIIIDGLINDREFIKENEKGQLIPTEKGLAFANCLPEETLRPDMTALWHIGMEEIQNGEKSLDTFMEELQTYLSNHVDEVKKTGINIEVIGGIDCPSESCTGVLRRRKGKTSFFWGCSNYQAGCKESYQDIDGQPALTSYVCPACNENDLIFIETKEKKRFWSCRGYKDGCNATFQDKKGAPELTVYDCPDCNKNILRRVKGENNWFWGCTGFKDGCKGNFQDYKGKPLLDVIICPACNKDNLRLLKSEKGFFWGCAGYKNGCKTVYADNKGKPFLDMHDCPKCDGKLKQIKADKNVFWGCSNYAKDCKTTYQDYNDKPILEEHKCPKCNDGILRIYNGTKGWFWACNKYKEGCKSTFENKSGSPHLK